MTDSSYCLKLPQQTSSERGISLLETALILIPLTLFLVGVIGIIDFIRVGKIVSRTQDEYLRSLNGRPYRFDGGVIVFDRDRVDQGIEKTVTDAYAALGSQICGNTSGCLSGVGIQAAIQEVSINPTDGSVQSVSNPQTKLNWKKGKDSDMDSAALFNNFRTQTNMLGMPSGLFGKAFLPTTVLVSLRVSFDYEQTSYTQEAFTIFGLGKAREQSAQVVMLRGEIE